MSKKILYRIKEVSNGGYPERTVSHGYRTPFDAFMDIYISHNLSLMIHNLLICEYRADVEGDFYIAKALEIKNQAVFEYQCKKYRTPIDRLAINSAFTSSRHQKS